MSTPDGLRVADAARRLAEEVIVAVEECPRHDHGKVRAQLAAAANSVGANIAEGCGRDTPAEQLRYFRMARGSLDEVRHHLRVCVGTGLLSQKAFQHLWNLATVTRRMLCALIVRLERKPPDPRP